MKKIPSMGKLRFGINKEGLTGAESDRITKQMLLAISIAINQKNMPKIKETLIDIKVYLEDHLLTFTCEDTIERPYPERDFVKGLELRNGKVDFNYFKTCLKDALRKIEKMKPSGFIKKRSDELGIEINKMVLKNKKKRIKENQKYLRKKVEEDLEMLKNLIN